MDSQRHNRGKQLLSLDPTLEKAFPVLAVVGFLLFALGLFSYFGAPQGSVAPITSSASEGARIRAIQERSLSGETSYQYKTDQLPPPMASQ